MSIKEKFAETADQDPRIAELKIAQRNFERTASRELRNTIINGGLFEIFQEVLKMDPGSRIVYDPARDCIPSFCWQHTFSDSTKQTRSLEFYFSDKTLFLVVMGKAEYEEYEISNEKILLGDLKDKTKFESAILDALNVGGFLLGPQRERLIDTKDLDPRGHFRALRLHPYAFRDLTDEEAERLIKTMYRFNAKRDHPDHGGSDESMRRINEARDFFSDPKNGRQS